MASYIQKVNGLIVRCSVFSEGDRMDVDLQVPGDRPTPEEWTGPRFVFERIKEPHAGWKVLIHGNGQDDPSHCVVVYDTCEAGGNAIVFDEYEQWPETEVK